jgi:hypothetical protein
MAKALAHGLITESEYEMRRWAKRCEQIADFADTIYGEHTTRALLDQARAAARSDCHHASPLLGGVSPFGDKAKRVRCLFLAMDRPRKFSPFGGRPKWKIPPFGGRPTSP